MQPLAKRFHLILTVAAAVLVLRLPSGEVYAQTPTASHVISSMPVTPPPAFSGGVEYDQTDNPGLQGAASQFFTDLDGRVHAADDFVVPVGETWELTSVFALGAYTTGGGPAANFDVVIYQDASGLPGAVAFADSAVVPLSVFDGDITIDLTTPAILGEGTYWLSVVANMPFTPDGQWYWRTATVQTGNPYAWEDPDGVVGIPECVTWQPGASVCGAGGGEDPDLSFSISGNFPTAIEGGSEFPASVTLGRNYPNPLSLSTSIPFEVSEISDIRIAVYDVLGREVAVVVNQTYTPGAYSVGFDGADLPSGIYVYRLEVNGGVQVRAMSLVK